ncbi:MAG TPA: hypothetical protein VGM05_26390 [Planctomycetaceae bacterium]
MAVAIPINGERTSGNGVGIGLFVVRNDEGLAIDPLQNFRFPKRPVPLAVQNLK